MTTPLTDEHIRAIRHAHQLIFDYIDHGDRETISPTNLMVSVMANRYVKSVVIPCDTEIERYPQFGKLLQVKQCWWAVEIINPIAETFANLLQAGDLLTVKWVGNNETLTVQSHDLATDELRVIVRRVNQTYEFLLDYMTMETNSSIRMIQYY